MTILNHEPNDMSMQEVRYMCSWDESIGCVQGGATKLKEYMRSLNILPQKRKRKPSDGIPRSPRSPRSPDGLLPGISDLKMRGVPCYSR